MASEKTIARKVLLAVAQIPTFASEDEEAEFWARHSLGPEILAQAEPIPDGELPPPRERPRTKPVSVRLDDTTLRRLQALARRRHTGYQTLLKQFVLERLYEEEKREQIVGT